MAVRGGSIRSGRFKLTNSTTSDLTDKIIQLGKGAAVYRFFNSGSKPFKVREAGSTLGINVDSKNSMDVIVPVNKEIEIVVAPGDSVEGIYDYVEENLAVRNGRFTGEINSTTVPTIISGTRDEALYRIFNSGDNDFDIRYGSVTSTISKRQSHDFVVNDSVQLIVGGTTNVEVNAIYDLLEPNKPIRSGRFKRDTTPDVLHEIINFSGLGGGSSPVLWYRLFNSGDHPIVIVAKSTAGPEQTLKTLEIEQSFDIRLDHTGFTGKKTIWIKSTAADKPIEGIYEFLGKK